MSKQRVLIACIIVFVLGGHFYRSLAIATTQIEVASLGDYGTITWDTTLTTPDAAKLVSLFDLFFELHPSTPLPESINIWYLSYEDFEIELAIDQAGLNNWQGWLQAYKTNSNTMLVDAFVGRDALENGTVELFTYVLEPSLIVHELTHWHCYTTGPAIRSGFHTQRPWGDCTTAASKDLIHSLQYRTWLREQPWH